MVEVIICQLFLQEFEVEQEAVVLEVSLKIIEKGKIVLFQKKKRFAITIGGGVGGG